MEADMKHTLQELIDEFLKLPKQEQQRALKMMQAALEGDEPEGIGPPPTGDPPGGPPKP